MNCVLFPKMAQVFSLKKKNKHQNILKYWKNEKKNRKVRENGNHVIENSAFR